MGSRWYFCTRERYAQRLAAKAKASHHSSKTGDPWITLGSKPRALVLFCGTGSVDRSLEAVGFEVDSLDIDPKCGATWTSDVLNWESWRQIPAGTYEFVWASPPCQQRHAWLCATTNVHSEISLPILFKRQTPLFSPAFQAQ